MYSMEFIIKCVVWMSCMEFITRCVVWMYSMEYTNKLNRSSLWSDGTLNPVDRQNDRQTWLKILQEKAPIRESISARIFPRATMPSLWMFYEPELIRSPSLELRMDLFCTNWTNIRATEIQWICGTSVPWDVALVAHTKIIQSERSQKIPFQLTSTRAAI